MRDAARSLAEKLRAMTPAQYHVVCLPDFYLDHFVELPPWDEASQALARVHAQGGGNLQNVPQRFACGGNAANTALALARLGVRSHLVTRTSRFGYDTLALSLAPAGVDLTRVRQDGEIAVTTALEFGETKANVMLSHPGSIGNYRFSDLDDNDVTLIEGSDAVLIANWSQNVGGGSDLLTEVASLARGAGTLSYADTGDPSGRARDVPQFVDDVLAKAPLDVLAVNENELTHFARLPRGANESTSDLLTAGRHLKDRFHGALDLHTSAFAASWSPEGGEPAVASSWRVTMRRATGAGDAWNAGNLLGHLSEMRAEERLLLANAVAALYISSPDARHPSVAEVAEFVSERAR